MFSDIIEKWKIVHLGAIQEQPLFVQKLIWSDKEINIELLKKNHHSFKDCECELQELHLMSL